jgi:hypothetical protein
MNKKIVLFVLLVSFILIASCKKEEPIIVTYDRLETGLADVNKVYMINGIKEIVFGVPEDAIDGTTISVSAGEYRLDGQNITATKEETKKIEVSSNWIYVRFNSQKSEKVDILYILKN